MSFTRKALKEIQNAMICTDYDFFMDESGLYGDRSNCYLRWTPSSGIFENQTHILCFKFVYGSNVPKSYPKNPPNVQFKTPIYHTNVGSSEGSICLDVLKENPGKQSWSPMYGIDAILNSIQLLMEEHNPSSPMNGEAGRLYNSSKSEKNNMLKYKTHAMQYYAGKMDALSNDNPVKRLMTAPEFIKEEKEEKDKTD